MHWGHEDAVLSGSDDGWSEEDASAPVPAPESAPQGSAPNAFARPTLALVRGSGRGLKPLGMRFRFAGSTSGGLSACGSKLDRVPARGTRSLSTPMGPPPSGAHVAAAPSSAPTLAVPPAPLPHLHCPAPARTPARHFTGRENLAPGQLAPLPLPRKAAVATASSVAGGSRVPRYTAEGSTIVVLRRAPASEPLAATAPLPALAGDPKPASARARVSAPDLCPAAVAPAAGLTEPVSVPPLPLDPGGPGPGSVAGACAPGAGGRAGRRGRGAEASPSGPTWGSNFVRINLRNGRGSSKYKPSGFRPATKKGGRWRSRATALAQGGDGEDYLDGWKGKQTVCFKCGRKGHWSSECTAEPADTPDSANDESRGGGDGVTGAAAAPVSPPTVTWPVPTGGTGVVEPAHPPGSLGEDIERATPVTSLMPSSRGDCPSPPLSVAPGAQEVELAQVLRDEFGYESFRGQQLPTVRAILRGESCLSVMPTGMGKSLCYQLPALIAPGLTLVVTPLIALMLDQVAHAPARLCAAALWSGQSRSEALAVLEGVKSGTHRLLFVSPERLSSSHFLEAVKAHLPFSKVVVDECHCMTEWGHSFRPSYYKLGRQLFTPELHARAVLALTATCTRTAQRAIASRLGITTIFRDAAVRDNLRLRVDRKQTSGLANVATWVSRLLSAGELADARSAIVFCAFKELTQSIASELRAAGVSAAAYHAGKSHQERTSVTQDFSVGRLRVVVATVAFGMGIHLPHLDAVVHASLPRSPEEYVQQIGRAGRDGQEARCFAYLDDAEFLRMRSLAYASAVEEGTVLRILERILCAPPVRSAAGSKRGRGPSGPSTPSASYRHLDLKKLSAELDAKPDVIEGVLAHLEVREPPLLRTYASAALRVKVTFYGETPEVVGNSHRIIKVLLGLKISPRNGVYGAWTSELANAAGLPPGIVLRELAAAAATKQVGFVPSSEDGPMYRLLQPAAAPGDLDPALVRSVSAWITGCLVHQVRQLDTSYRQFRAAAEEAATEACEVRLRAGICRYMDDEGASAHGLSGDAPETVHDGIKNDCPQEDSDAPLPPSSISLASGEPFPDGSPLVPPTPSLLMAVRAAVRQVSEPGCEPVSALALTRMLHGLGSPAHPADTWRRRAGPFWGSQQHTDFAVVLRVASVAMQMERGDGSDAVAV